MLERDKQLHSKHLQRLPEELLSTANKGQLRRQRSPDRQRSGGSARPECKRRPPEARQLHRASQRLWEASGLRCESRLTYLHKVTKKPMIASLGALEKICSMSPDLERFERVVRRSAEFTDSAGDNERLHAFDLRNVHQKLPNKCRILFDDCHYSQSTFEACKYIDKEIQRFTNENKSGYALMMSVFGGNTPKLKIANLTTQTGKDEQEGFKFLLAGAMLAIRNPRGHEYKIEDDPDTCLDYLVLISALLRTIERAGFELKSEN